MSDDGKVAIRSGATWVPYGGSDVGDQLQWDGSIWIKRRGWISPSVDLSGNPLSAGTNLANINAALASRAGACVYIPAGGRVCVDGQILFTQSGSTLLGDADGFLGGSRLQQVTATPIDLIKVTGVQSCRIQGFYIDSDRVHTSGNAILLDGAFDTFIENVRIGGMANGLSHYKSVLTHVRHFQCGELFGTYGIKMRGELNADSHALNMRDLGMNVGFPFGEPNGVINGWATATSYAQGQVVFANGNYYQKSNAGTQSSAGSGTGPSGIPSTDPIAARTTDITDGACRWRYLHSGSLYWLTHDSYAHSFFIDGQCGLIHGARGLQMQDAANTGSSFPQFLHVAPGLAIDHPLNVGIWLEGGAGAELHGALVTSACTWDGINIRSTFARDWRIDGCKVQFCAQNGIEMLRGFGQVLNTKVVGCSGRTANTFDGIRAGNGLTDYQIVGCWSGWEVGPTATAQRYGIHNGNASNDHFNVSNNYLRGNTTGGLNNPAGTSANRRVTDGNITA
jgi:hypothetical protein